MASHPDIVVEKKSDSPDEDKCVHDSKLLIPTLKDFFSRHPLIHPKTFLGDAAFDTVELYKLHLNVDEWSTSIRKRIFALIPEQSGEPTNGTTPTKSEQLLKETSITSRIIFVLQDAELKTRRLYTLI